MGPRELVDAARFRLTLEGPSPRIAPGMRNETGLDANQIYYLRTVLGVESIVFPRNIEPVTVPVQQEASAREVRRLGTKEKARIVALLPTPGKELPLSDETKTLVEKMILAMKLKADEVYFAVWPAEEEALSEEVKRELGSGGERTPVLLFGAFGWKAVSDRELSPGDIVELGERRVFVTFSPGELLRTPTQKRLAWVHLQNLMKEL